jgi:hypothetical protein
MKRIDDEFALLLHGVDTFEVDMARNLLEQAGIPSLAHGPDFDVAELGVAGHGMARGRGVYVPKAVLDRARDVVREAWGERADAVLSE